MMMRRIVAQQMAAAIEASMPPGTFDAAAFVDRMLADDSPPAPAG